MNLLIRELRKDPGILNDYLIDNNIHRKLLGAEKIDEYGTEIRVNNLFEFIKNDFLYWPIKDIILDDRYIYAHISMLDDYHNLNIRAIIRIIKRRY